MSIYILLIVRIFLFGITFLSGTKIIMYPSRLYDILMYGGALLIILGIVCITALIVLLYKWNRMISTGTRAIQYVGSSMLVPLLSVVGLLRDSFKPTKSKKDI